MNIKFEFGNGKELTVTPEEFAEMRDTLGGGSKSSKSDGGKTPARKTAVWNAPADKVEVVADGDRVTFKARGYKTRNKAIAEVKAAAALLEAKQFHADKDKVVVLKNGLHLLNVGKDKDGDDILVGENCVVAARAVKLI